MTEPTIYRAPDRVECPTCHAAPFEACQRLDGGGAMQAWHRERSRVPYDDSDAQGLADLGLRFFLIRYRYPGTVNGEPVGLVYVDAIPPRLAGPNGGFSYTKEPRKASAYIEQRARQIMSGKHWPEATLVPMAEAEDLR